MNFIKFPAMTLGITMIALGVVGCSSGDNGKAPPAKSSAVEKSPAPAKIITPTDSPAPARVSTPTASTPLAASTASANGADLYKTKTCIACHGADAKTPIMSTYPKIAGQNEQYVIAQMNDIKSGARSNGQTAAMKGIMHLVSDAEIAAIAEWLSGLDE
jgi:cytochrome c